MSTQGSTAKYIEQSSQTYKLLVDTLASATRSRLDYWKSVWGIVTRPYASTEIGSIVRANFDRTGELIDVTVNELNSRSQRTVEFSEKLVAQIEQLQDTARDSYRDSFKSNGTAVGHVKDASYGTVREPLQARETEAVSN